MFARNAENGLRIIGRAHFAFVRRRGGLASFSRKLRTSTAFAWILFSITICTLVSAKPADANRFSFQDSKMLDELKRKILSAQQDNLEIAQSLNQQHAF